MAERQATKNARAIAERGMALANESARLRTALEKINRIRNIVVGTQSAGWSSTIYPLVAALDEAGFEVDPLATEAALKGLPYGPGCTPDRCSIDGCHEGRIAVEEGYTFRRCMCTCHHPPRQTRL